MKHHYNTQTRFVLRLFLMVMIAIGMMCAGAVALGTFYPTQLILAQTYSITRATSGITLLDVNRNLPINYSFPSEYRGQFTPSADGHRVIISAGTIQQQYAVWDIFTGRIIYLTDIFPNCLVVNPTWLRDSRHIIFSCQTNIQGGMMGGLNVLDFETGDMNLFYSQSQYVTDNQWSPNLNYVGIDVNNTVRIMGLDGTSEQIITPPNKWQRFIGWEKNAESVLVYGLKSIERYTFATDSWEVLLADFQITQQPVLSPDGTWVAIISGLRTPRPYVFNLLTSELIALSSSEFDISDVDLLQWSPDSQWLVIRSAQIDGNIHYLAKPDASDIRLISENIEAPPVWSPDGRKMSYEIYAVRGNNYFSDVMVWDMLSPPQAIMRDTHSPLWSPDGNSLAFIFYPQQQQLWVAVNGGDMRPLTGDDVVVAGFIFVK
ncbi:MAG: hypothetical protein SFZ02_00740 [bacterium]|nr:hypothetical protein [bacterium]